MLEQIYATDAFNNMKIVYELISYAGFREQDKKYIKAVRGKAMN